MSKGNQKKSEKKEKLEAVIETGKKTAKKAKIAAKKAQSAAVAAGESGKQLAEKTKDAIIAKLDQDGNGQVDSGDIIILALKVPGVRINRTEFLKKELNRHCEPNVIKKAIATTPVKAGVDAKLIDKLADETIKFERNAVSGISLALGMPGGVAMAATIPADIVQYYGYMLRAAQKMLYLYGFPEIKTDKESLTLDTETINSLTVCLGIMYGVASANNAIKAIAKALAAGVEKQLLKKALTKGAIYPIVKQIAKYFTVSMTKEVFAGFFKKTIPVVGGVIGGGITFATFKPCCYRLKNALADTSLSNPEHQETDSERRLFEAIEKDRIIDVDPDDIVELDDLDEFDDENFDEDSVDEEE